MKFFRKAKDGGPQSTVTGYWLCEIKSLFSIVLLRFDDGSRDEYHSHAFDSLNWVLRGCVVEQDLFDTKDVVHRPSPIPILTRREKFHRVLSRGTTWVFSIRGPWSETWAEYDPRTERFVLLKHGRQPVRSADVVR